MTNYDALEFARCANINLDNLAKMNPMLKQHPFFVLVKEQIKSCIEELDERNEPGKEAGNGHG